MAVPNANESKAKTRVARVSRQTPQERDAAPERVPPRCLRVSISQQPNRNLRASMALTHAVGFARRCFARTYARARIRLDRCPGSTLACWKWFRRAGCLCFASHTRDVWTPARLLPSSVRKEDVSNRLATQPHCATSEACIRVKGAFTSSTSATFPPSAALMSKQTHIQPSA